MRALLFSGALAVASAVALADGLPQGPDPCWRPDLVPLVEPLTYEQRMMPLYPLHEVDEPHTLWLVVPGMGMAAGVVGWARWQRAHRRGRRRR
jgi:hypothetical protein